MDHSTDKSITTQSVSYLFAAVPKPLRLEPICPNTVAVNDTFEKVEYRLLFAFGKHSLVYSTLDTSETLNRLWRAYSEV